VTTTTWSDSAELVRYTDSDQQRILEFLRRRGVDPSDGEAAWLWSELGELSDLYQLHRERPLSRTNPMTRREFLTEAKAIEAHLRSVSRDDKPKIIAAMNPLVFRSVILRVKLHKQIAQAHLTSKLPQIEYWEQDRAAELAERPEFLANFQDALAAVIAEWKIKIRSTKQRRGPTRHAALHWFAGYLGLVYFNIFHKPPGYSTSHPEEASKRRQRGPFHEFVELCVLPLDKAKPTPSAAIDKAVRSAVAWFKRQHKK
jgi:hypothetical protein